MTDAGALPCGTEVPHGAVRDTTDDPRWTPVTVVARMTEPVVELDTNPLLLDGPLSWCAYLAAAARGAAVPPVGTTWAADLAVPLGTWTAPADGRSHHPRLAAADPDRLWGWACSRALYTAACRTAVQLRRKPATHEMTRLTDVAKFHVGQGPHKARNLTVSATWAPEIRWHALADPDRLTDLLGHLTHLGKFTRHGWGAVASVEVVADGRRDRWTDRPFPDPDGTPGTVRAPHHHVSRRALCSSTRPA